MSGDVIELIARLAGSVVDRAHVAAGERYRIGTAPGVELPIATGALRAFPLIDHGHTFRRPAGIAARLHADGVAREVTEAALVLARGARIELALGQVTLELARIERARVPVPRPRFDRRPLGYAAVALLAHLGVWAAAMRAEPLERLPAETVVLGPVRLPPVAEPPPPPPKPPAAKTKQQEPASGAAAVAQRDEGPRDPRARAIAGARRQGVFEALSDLSALVPSVDVRKLVEDSVFYDEVEATKSQFGNARRFDPMKNCTKDCGTIKTGRYATVASGHAAGDDYEIPGGIRHPQPEMALCTSGPCHIEGALARDVIHHQLDLRLGAYGYCYQRFAIKKLTGSIALSFTIAPDGTVIAPRAKGMPEIDACVGEVLGVIVYPIAAAPTRVTYTVSFRPS